MHHESRETPDVSAPAGPPELRLFGAVAVLGPDGRALAGAAAQPRRLAVLSVLADAAPAPVTRDRLIALIWPDHPEAGARRLLTQSLYAIRRELGEVVTGTGRDLALDTAALRVDLVELRRALENGELERATSLHRGPLFAGFHLRGSGEFDRWADGVRAQVERQLQRALESHVAKLEAGGDPREAARWGERLVQAAPYDASAVLQCMTLWERAGDPRAALAAATAYEQRMRGELELEPDARVVTRAAEIASRAGASGGAGALARAGTRGTKARTQATDIRGVPASDEAGAIAAEAVGDAARELPGTKRRRVPAFLIVMSLATLAAIGALLVRQPQAGERSPAMSDDERAVAGGAASALPPLVVHPFALQGVADSTHLGAASARTLAALLDGSGGRRVAFADSAPGQQDDTSASWISGALAGSGAQLRLDVEMRLPAGAVRASVTGPRDSLIALVERVAVQLVPAFYEVPPSQDAPHARFTSARALRLHLDGEAAMRRGAFAAAHEAFRGAVEVDSSLAWTWYRRAVAADNSYDEEDAGLSLGEATSRRARLTQRERTLVRAFSRWRAGDLEAAEPLYRELLNSGADDEEAWLHFAELAYHGWPLHGRQLDSARDAWQRVVALDSGNVTGLVHAIRLAARARDTATVRVLLERLERSGAGEPALSESRLVAAVATGLPLTSPAGKRMLAPLQSYSLYFLHWVMAGILERPLAGAEIAALLTDPRRAVSVRAEGHVALAHLAAARGQLKRARAELSLARRLDPVDAAWSRAYLAALPYLDAVPAEVRAARQELASAPRDAATAPLYLQLAVEAPAAEVIEGYLERLLAARADSATRDADPLRCGAGLPTITRELCGDLAIGLTAEALLTQDRHSQALRELSRLRMRVPYQIAGRSSYFARSRERFVRAQLLERAGRLEEAYRWYAAAPQGSRLDYVYLAPSHLARGRIREREGDAASAAEHYRSALELWRHADAELAPLVRQAREGLGRVSGGTEPDR